MADGEKFSCSACRRSYAWKPELAGKRAKCKCGQAILVPSAPPQEAIDGPPDFDSDEFARAAAALDGPSVVRAEIAVAPRPVGAASGRAAASPRPSAAARPSGKQKLSDRWWYTTGLGLIVFPMAFYEFSRLSEMEQHGGSVHVTTTEYLMYNIAGRWGVLIFMLIMSACCLIFGIRQFLKLRRK